MSRGRVRFGSCGWDFRDWQGPLYPQPRPKGFRALPLLARFTDFTEVNATFYRPLRPEFADRWLAETPAAFTFAFKAWQGWTHEGRAPRGEEADLIRSLGTRLLEAERCEGMLAQLPPSRQLRAGELHHAVGPLRALRDAFRPIRLWVEVRHRSWLQRPFLDWLQENRIGFVNVDLPPVRSFPPLTTINTGPQAYLRLHGRNRPGWTRLAASRDERYDYDYPLAECEELLATVARLAERAPRLLVGANNHYRAQAPATLVRLRSLWQGAPVAVPAALLRAYPDLRSCAGETF